MNTLPSLLETISEPLMCIKVMFLAPQQDCSNPLCTIVEKCPGFMLWSLGVDWLAHSQDWHNLKMERDLEMVLAESREAQKTHFASFTMFLGSNPNFGYNLRGFAEYSLVSTIVLPIPTTNVISAVTQFLIKWNLRLTWTRQNRPEMMNIFPRFYVAYLELKC